MNKLQNIESDILSFMETMKTKYFNSYSQLLKINKKRAFELFYNDLKEGNPIALNNIQEFFMTVLHSGLNLRYFYIERFLEVANSKDVYLLLYATDLDKRQSRINYSYTGDSFNKVNIRKNIILNIINGDYDEEEKYEIIDELFQFEIELDDECIDLLLNTGYIKDGIISSLNGCTIASAEKLIINDKVNELFFSYRGMDKDNYIETIKEQGCTY